MQIYTNNKKLQNSLNRKEYQELLSYFQALPEPVILRDIRKKFPEKKHLDKELDLLIDNQILLRKDRRYQLGLRIEKEYPTTERVETFYQEVSAQCSNEQLLVWLGEEFLNTELEDTVAIDFPLVTCNQLENVVFKLVTINNSSFLSETLPNYFKNSAQPELFPTISKLIGDVNSEFFVNQIGLIIERVMSGRAPRRESIFLDSLLMSQVILKQPEWHISVPKYEEPVLTDWLPKMTNETKFFFTHQLAERLLSGQESFTYLIKKKA